jgi:dolichol-phosphate mannosyltransferase
VKISVVLPTYNESANIVRLVQAIISRMPREHDYEIIVVDDNSPDGTSQTVRDAFVANSAVMTLLRTSDRGLANSIRAGIEKARGDQLVVMDSDFTHDPDEIPKMLRVGEVYDIVSGSRFCAGGRMQDTPHYIASLVYNWLIRLVLRTQIQDNLGGFFTMSRQKLLRLPLDAIFFGYGDYFFRLLHFAQAQGFTVVEIPAQYASRHSGTSKSNFFKLLLSYTQALLRLKIYGPSSPPRP